MYKIKIQKKIGSSKLGSTVIQSVLKFHQQ